MELSPLIQNSVQQDYFPELYPMYLPSSQICSLLWCCFVAPSKCGLPPSPELLWEILEMEENPTQQPNIYLFPPSRKSPLIEICLPLSKVSFLSHHIAFSINHPMQASFVAVVISVASFFNFRLDPILIYRFYWMFSLAWQKHWMVKALPSKIPILSTFQYYLENPVSLKLVFLFFTLPFLFQTIKNFNWHHSSWDFMACELIKYNGFQISGNRSYETHYLMP